MAEPESELDGMWGFDVDEARIKRTGQTRVYVRARFEGEFASYDIATLTRESLLNWIRSAEHPQMRAEAVLLALLDHEP